MKRLASMVALLLMTALIGAHAAPTTPAAVTADEKAAAVALIKDLYQAYSNRDVDKVMALEHDFIESTAKAYEAKKGAGKGDELRDAFRGVTDEILHSKQFAMKPLHLEDVEYRREGDNVVVSSAIPIIATEYVEVQGDGSTGNKARLRIGKFWMKKSGDSWRIERLDLQG